MKKSRYIIIILFAVMCLLEFLNVHLLNKVTTDSIYASRVKNEVKQYEEDNTVLRIKVLQQTSMNALSLRAKALGFVEPTEFVSLYSPLQVARSNE